MGGERLGCERSIALGYGAGGSGRPERSGLICTGQPTGSKNSGEYSGVEGGYHEDTVSWGIRHAV